MGSIIEYNDAWRQGSGMAWWPESDDNDMWVGLYLSSRSVELILFNCVDCYKLLK